MNCVPLPPRLPSIAQYESTPQMRIRRLPRNRSATSTREMRSPTNSATFRPFLKGLVAKVPLPSIAEGLTSIPSAHCVFFINRNLQSSVSNSKVPVMSSDPPFKEHVFQMRAEPDVMHDGITICA